MYCTVHILLYRRHCQHINMYFYMYILLFYVDGMVRLVSSGASFYRDGKVCSEGEVDMSPVVSVSLLSYFFLSRGPSPPTHSLPCLTYTRHSVICVSC